MIPLTPKLVFVCVCTHLESLKSKLCKGPKCGLVTQPAEIERVEAECQVKGDLLILKHRGKGDCFTQKASPIAFLAF